MLLEAQQRAIGAALEMVNQQAEANKAAGVDVNPVTGLTPDQEQALGVYIVDIQRILTGAAEAVSAALNVVRDAFDRTQQ